jgi:hypothetical protein
MTLEEMALRFADQGFAYFVAVYLLYRYHTTDREYLKVLQDLSATMHEHTRQKDEVLQMLKEAQKK